MEWTDQGIVLGTRRYGEASVILEVMTPTRGRHLGLVRGGASRRLAPLLQPGNTVEAHWRARLDDQLGHFTVEPLAMRAARLIDDAGATYALQTLTAHLRLLPERDPHPALHGAVESALDSFAAEGDFALFDAAAFIARFELALLQELGFGLDLSVCAATGAHGDLAYVSPKSGRAVSRAGAAGYEERLLPLPAFLRGARGHNIGPFEIRDAFRLTGHFLHRHIYDQRAIPEPDSRARLLALVERRGEG